ncbi:N-acetylmuramoyl-L-alanine amidase family protein [Paenibacillus sp. JX-17]|uniref:N-acetylmuramoyl-L-alanine amidase family protein n=1 Tax=Paenibacillus lacisoli TaxID=3064525 RepID=A0ABT9C6Y4_9BACL|nr:N-acetylmuramoyl-L-alanine amidase family protein [Paenibacillus sp. JX-17]MDO7905009.1 N-acetylmuramoyl-L-alanine amidase family protein [Paenibacillus sp. JX-17]
MKKLGFLMFLFIFMLVVPGHGHAATTGNTSIFLDGKKLNLPGDVQVELLNNKVMIPIRVVSENLGYNVGWDQNSKIVTIQSENTTITMTVGVSQADVSGQKVALDAAPVLRGGTTLVPLRFVGEQMGLKVSWDNTSKSVYLITQNNSGENTPVSDLAMVKGISFSDNRLLIAMDGNVKPNVFTMTGPNRVVVDLPQAAFSSTFGDTQSLNAQLNGEMEVTGNSDVSKVRYSLYNNNPSTVRVVVDVSKAKNFAISNPGTGTLIVTLSDGQASKPVGSGGKKIVVIDAGHGAKDPGAAGVSGTKEKDFNLAMALKVANLLKQNPNIDVVLTRSDDTFLELKDRVKIANDLKADVFVSIHANSSGSSAATGTETYYQRAESKALANTIHKYFAKATGLTDRGVRYGNFHVIRETKMAAVLLEVGYLSNKNDEKALFNTSFQTRVAQGVVDGIEDYLGLK